MLYVINRQFDENNNHYPNYYIDNKDGVKIYYDIYLNKIDEKDYGKFGINKSSFSGSGLIGGMMTGGVGDAGEEKQIDVIEEATQWIMVKNILLSLSYQSYFGQTAQTNLQRKKLFQVLNIKNLYILWDDVYYTFNWSNVSAYCRELVSEKIICSTKFVNVPRKAFYTNMQSQDCINIFCINAAKYDKIINQRQECSKCIDYRNDPYTNSRPIGYFFKFVDKKIKIDGKSIKVREINASIKYVDTVYTNMCHNNFNPSYWNTLKVKKNGKKIIEPGYKFEYKDPKTGKLLPIKINGKNYRCELKNPWNSYGKGLIELDHINGIHQQNDIVNISPLCKICHGIKTDQQQDKANKKKEEGGIVIEGNAETIRKYVADYGTDEKKAKKNIKLITDIINNNILKSFFIYDIKENKLISNSSEIVEIWEREEHGGYNISMTDAEIQQLAEQLRIEEENKKQKVIDDEQDTIDEIDDILPSITESPQPVSTSSKKGSTSKKGSNKGKETAAEKEQRKKKEKKIKEYREFLGKKRIDDLKKLYKSEYRDDYVINKEIYYKLEADKEKEAFIINRIVFINFGSP